MATAPLFCLFRVSNSIVLQVHPHTFAGDAFLTSRVGNSHLGRVYANKLGSTMSPFKDTQVEAQVTQARDNVTPASVCIGKKKKKKKANQVCVCVCVCVCVYVGILLCGLIQCVHKKGLKIC